MSNKSKHRRPPRPYGSTLPVMSMQEIIEVLAGKEPPTCCTKHQTEYTLVTAMVRNSPAGAPCFLCGQPSSMRSVFVPQDAQRYGAPIGKTRLLFFNLCTACFEQPDREAVIEARALQDVQQGHARAKAPWN